MDDDARVRGAVARGLRQHFDVVPASTALEALEHLSLGEFDAILTDYQMPGPDGLWLLEQAQARCLGGLRLLTSGSALSEVESVSSAPAVHRFFPKPLDMRAFIELLEAPRDS